jgi:hypothetical protein
MGTAGRALVRINRYVAYLLIPVTLFMFITGFRMTGTFTFFSRGSADLLHRIYVHIAFVVLFSVHVVLSVRIAFARRGVRSRFLDWSLAAAGVGLAAYFSVLSLRLILPLGW